MRHGLTITELVDASVAVNTRSTLKRNVIGFPASVQVGAIIKQTERGCRIAPTARPSFNDAVCYT